MAKIVLSKETKLLIAEITGLTFLAPNIENFFDSSEGPTIKALLKFHSTTKDVLVKVDEKILPAIKKDVPEIEFEPVEGLIKPKLLSTAPTELHVDDVVEFEATTIANDYASKMVYSVIAVTNKDSLKVEYYEPNGDKPGWLILPLNADGEFQFGTDNGFPCADTSSKFRITGLSENVCNINTKLVLAEDKSTMVEIDSAITILPKLAQETEE